ASLDIGVCRRRRHQEDGEPEQQGEAGQEDVEVSHGCASVLLARSTGCQPVASQQQAGSLLYDSSPSSTSRFRAASAWAVPGWSLTPRRSSLTAWPVCLFSWKARAASTRARALSPG